MSSTTVVLDVSADCFREIQEKLEAAGFHHAFTEDAGGQLIIDLHHLALRDGETDTSEAPAGSPVGFPILGQDKQGRPS